MARKRSMRQMAWEKSGGNCCLCGLPMQVDCKVFALNYTVEHIIPRARGGVNEIENCDGAHQYCNQFKNDSLIEELPQGYKKFLRWKIKHLIKYAL